MSSVRPAIATTRPSKLSAAHPTTPDTFSIVQRIIAEVSGNELEDITLDADFEGDLGINMMGEFQKIVRLLQRETDTTHVAMAAFEDCATVAELIELIDEEREL